MATQEQIVDALASLTLFADLSRPELEGVAHTLEEQYYATDERILRQGLTGSGFFIILEGEAAVRINGKNAVTLERGDFFGEISILLGESPVADVVAVRPMRCLFLPGPQVEPFMIAHPKVLYRFLQAEARKLRDASRSRT